MKILTRFSFVSLIFLVFVACNKDEEIIIDNPGSDNGGSGNTGNDVKLDYSVIDYTPAPGQYINEVANGSAGLKTMKEAVDYAESRLKQSLYVSLGAWGGSLTVKFNTPIKNSGDYDFSIGSNTFDTSNEPGIVWVMQDTNGNGQPDDEWLELKGSYFGKEDYERNYWVRYSRPESKGNTPWEDSNGETGFVYWTGNYHSQDFYYPEWIEEDSYTLYGSRLPLQAWQDPDTGNWENLPFDWGYADNYGLDFFEDNHTNSFRISDAVTSENEPANLEYIDFIKVQTAINGSAGWLGENSTEVSGFYKINK